MAPWEDYLKKIYFDPKHPASFSGPQKLYNAVKREGNYNIGMHRIRQFLHNQESYSLHKPVRRRFQRNHVVSAGIDDLWMADLIDMVKFANWNDGYKYTLLVIDTFSKYVWLQPLKSKTGEDVAKAFQQIFIISKRSPAKLITDKGQEFRTKNVQDVMRKKDIRYFPTQNETKASTSERAILTIKRKIYRYFTHTDDYSYLPVLQDMADSYNKTFHRTIGTTPANVEDVNEEEVRLATQVKEVQKSRKEVKRNSQEMKKETKFKVDVQKNIQQLLLEAQMKQQEKEKRKKMSSIKLPKIDLICFNGDKTRWTEF
ncbi:uncharacterized protein LOC132757608 [Ruditapes philippinarum]|uniref:uncharacterized protein LOC132757608 n=1 Tax=Ruditapes philippinarum TaxID=129788 RepID=UPI00295AD62D|nr:uncharacterized protein LOC132757608 [Ruditapes philippinarum]